MVAKGSGASKIKVAVAISGGGRTLLNLLRSSESDNSHYEVVGVVSSSDDCAGNRFAKEYNIPILVAEFTRKKASATSEALSKFLRETNADWVALGGFLKPFPLDHHLRDRVINIHPALLPNYGGKGMYGMNVHRSVFDNKDQKSGATIHFVNEKYDEGRIIAQVEVEVESSESPEEVAASVFEAECDLYPRVLNGLAKGKLPMENRDVFQYQFIDRVKE